MKTQAEPLDVRWEKTGASSLPSWIIYFLPPSLIFFSFVAAVVFSVFLCVCNIRLGTGGKAPLTLDSVWCTQLHVSAKTPWSARQGVGGCMESACVCGEGGRLYNEVQSGSWLRRDIAAKMPTSCFYILAEQIASAASMNANGGINRSHLHGFSPLALFAPPH